MNRFVFAVGLAIAAAGAPSAFAVNPANAGAGPSGGVDTATHVSYKSLMTPQERSTFREKVRMSATLEECKAYVDEWSKKFETRAKEKGVANVNLPKADTCERKRKADKPAKSAAAAAPAGSAAPVTPLAPVAPAKK